uniref:Putative secreted protein n=1 Tax=Anopheles darlingi TaxID=43151 RepID=A0A2M4DGA9_ANODA
MPLFLTLLLSLSLSLSISCSRNLENLKGCPCNNRPCTRVLRHSKDRLSLAHRLLRCCHCCWFRFQSIQGNCQEPVCC